MAKGVGLHKSGGPPHSFVEFAPLHQCLQRRLLGCPPFSLSLPLSRARASPLTLSMHVRRSQVSRKRLVYTLDDDCRPAVGADGATLVNAVQVK